MVVVVELKALVYIVVGTDDVRVLDLEEDGEEETEGLWMFLAQAPSVQCQYCRTRCWVEQWRFHSFLLAKLDGQPANWKTQMKGRVCCFLMWLSRADSSLKETWSQCGQVCDVLPVPDEDEVVVLVCVLGEVSFVGALGLGRLFADASAERGRAGTCFGLVFRGDVALVLGFLPGRNSGSSSFFLLGTILSSGTSDVSSSSSGPGRSG